jgi:murein L,D-transpeptidase YcbB/YkuD
MSKRRYRILAGTALALILAAPLVSMAKNVVTPIALPSDQLLLEIAHASVTPGAAIPAIDGTVDEARGNEAQGNAVSTILNAPAATVVEQTTIEPAPAPAPDPLASLDPADRAVAENIRTLFAAKADKLFSNSKERATVEAFYSGRHFAPLWIENGVEAPRAASVIARLKDADADGLEPNDYRTPSFAGLGPDALAEADVKLTRTVLTFARHLQAGRFHYTRVSRNIELPQAAPEAGDVLSGVANATDAGKALDVYSPQNEHYRKLKAKLAELRGKQVGAKGEASRQIEVIVANMERWRWYQRDLGNSHVVVNLPDFTLRVMHKGSQVWTTRVVIGKPSMATPLLSETMKSITVNPTWTVPQSIVRNEYLPALAQDPTVLERMGLRVSYNGGGVNITQPPGPGNALGRIRFNINNRFSVFQHDTQDKHMFAHDVRAYSHGCMRVQDPAKYAEVLLKIARPGENWSSERIQRMYGTSEQNLNVLPTMMWVHLTYQTAFVDDAGKLQMRRDVYNLDSRTIAAIKHERGNLETAPERKREEIAGSSPRKPAAPTRTGTLPMPIYR